MHHHPASSLLRATRSAQLLALAIALGGALALMPPAHAAKKSKKADSTSQPVAKKHRAKVKPSQNNSGETRAERDRRLQRECRGMPNAGACLGYAQP